MPVWAKKVDKNQSAIVKALRAIPGVMVELDKDDIFVGYMGRNYWFEIKDDDAVSNITGKVLDSKKKPHQKELEQSWPGHYRIVSTLEEILDDMKIK